jgi:hypothetical protein
MEQWESQVEVCMTFTKTFAKVFGWYLLNAGGILVFFGIAGVYMFIQSPDDAPGWVYRNIPWAIAIAAFGAGLVTTVRIVGPDRKLARELMQRPKLVLEYDQASCEKLVDDKYIFCVTVTAIQHSQMAEPVSGIIVALEHGQELLPHIHRAFAFKDYPNNESVTCNAGEVVRVNIMAYKPRSIEMIFQGRHALLDGAGPYVITIRATGGRAFPAYKRFLIGIRGETPFMEPIVE